MTTIYDVPPNDLIEKAAEQLQKIEEMKAPDWASYVKTGHFKDGPPVQLNWWYLRAAAILRYVYTRKRAIGVAKLRTKYGGKKNRGHKPGRQYKGSGAIIRKILQQLTKAGFIVYKEKEHHKGRILTPKGIAFLDKIASESYKSAGYGKKPEMTPAKEPAVKTPTEIKKEKQQPKVEPAKKTPVKALVQVKKDKEEKKDKDNKKEKEEKPKQSKEAIKAPEAKEVKPEAASQ